MSYRGGQQPDHMSTHNFRKLAYIPTNEAELSSFPRSFNHPDDMAFEFTAIRQVPSNGPIPASFNTLPPYQPYTREGRGSFDNSFSEYKDNHPSQSPPSSLSFHGPPTGHRSDPSFHLADHVTCSENAYLNSNRPRSTSSIGYGGSDYEVRIRFSPDQPSWKEESPSRIGPASNPGVRPSPSSNGTKAGGNFSSQRKPFNRDEFDGQVQYLSKPPPEVFAAQEQDLPQLPTNLLSNEQDDILSQVNDCLSQCAYDFVAKYEFPIPVEPDKRQVRAPVDREWTEWVYLLKRLATKRRIPARLLRNGQIKQLVTVLENSLEMRHAAKHQSRAVKDDYNILQLVSAGVQVALLLKDATASRFLYGLYAHTEKTIQGRKSTPRY